MTSTSPALLEIVRYATRVKYVDLARSIAKRLAAKGLPGLQAPPALMALQIIAAELAKSGDLAGAAAAIGEIDEMARASPTTRADT